MAYTRYSKANYQEWCNTCKEHITPIEEVLIFEQNPEVISTYCEACKEREKKRWDKIKSRKRYIILSNLFRFFKGLVIIFVFFLICLVLYIEVTTRSSMLWFR